VDLLTLRIAFGLVAVSMLVLFYGVTYRSTGSAFSGWWCLSLSSFLVSALLFALNGTPLQVVANPAGNTAGVLGAMCVWAGSASLADRPVVRRWLLVPPAAVAVLSAADHPGRDVWAGGEWYLATMGVTITLSAFELRRALRIERGRLVERPQSRFALVSIMLASALVGVYYAVRAVVFVAVGPDGRLFVVGFGGQATTLLTLILLVVVTFGMSGLCHEHQTYELRERATRDGMTGLLNRTEFLRSAQAEIDGGARASRCAVVVADLDRFKVLNDSQGHAAGDRALVAFAEACRRAVGGDGLVGRLGGDEFAILLFDGVLAEQVADDIGRHLAATETGFAMPTASFGIAAVASHRDIADVVTEADVALYQAKAAGRACGVRFDGKMPEPSAFRRGLG
jgi:diguanylate cyclase (GGDEF)-like protein